MNMHELVLGMQGTQDLSFAKIIIEVNNKRIPVTGFIIRKDDKDNPIIIIKTSGKMKIKITHNNIDWILFVDDYDAEEGQPATWGYYGGEPGYSDSITLNTYYLQLDPDKWDDELREKINTQLLDSDKLCEHVYELYEDDILHKALKQFLKDNEENY